MKDKLTISMIKKAVKILEEHKVTGDYEIRVNIVHFQEIVTEIFKMIKQTVLGSYDRGLPVNMLIYQLDSLEHQIQEDLSKSIN